MKSLKTLEDLKKDTVKAQVEIQNILNHLMKEYNVKVEDIYWKDFTDLQGRKILTDLQIKVEL